MKHRLMLLLAMFAVAGLLTATDARAQWGGDDAHGNGGGGEAMGGMADMGSALGLDDAQWEKFNDLRRKYRKETIGMQAKIDIAEVELEELADTDQMDMKKIGAKIREIADMKASLRTYRYKTLAEMRTFISAEQFDTFRWMGMKMGFDFGGGDKKDGPHGH
jgi:Spy/CpxP family protein refolding chaperone